MASWRDELIPPGRDTPPPRRAKASASWRDELVAPDEEEWRAPSRWDAFWRGAADGASLGFGDEGKGAVSGVSAMLHGEDFDRAYADSVAGSRARLAEAREIHPWTTGAGGFAGGAASFAVPVASAPLRALAGLKWTGGVGRALNLAAQGRGVRAVGAQALLGVGGGSTVGTVYGLGSGDDTLDSRLQTAGTGAMVGGAFGALSPAINSAMSAASYRIANPFMRAMRNIGASSKRGAPVEGVRFVSDDLPESAIPSSVVRDVDRILGDESMSVDDLSFAAAQAMDDPRGRVLADLFPSQGVDKVSYLAAAPGSTGPRALQIAQQRAQTQPLRLRAETKAALGADKTRLEARAQLQDDYANASEKLYAPLWENQPWTARQEGVWKGSVEPLLDARVNGRQIFREAFDRADEFYANDLLLGLYEGRAHTVSPGAEKIRRLHYAKIAVDDQISKWMEGGQSAASGKALRDAIGLQKQFVAALDEIIPGYQAARKEWAGIAEGDEALSAAARWLRGGDEAMRPEEVAAEFAAMSDFQKHYARLGLANVLDRRFASRSAVAGAENNQIKNAANVLSNDEVAQIVAQVFKTPQEAQAYLSALNEERTLLSNAAAWVQGPRTAQRMLHDQDRAADVIQEAALSPQLAVAQGGRRLLAAASQAIKRKENDALGRALLASIDAPTGPPTRGQLDDSAYVRALFEELRRLAERRAGMAAQAGRTAGAETTGLGSMIAPEEPQFF